MWHGIDEIEMWHGHPDRYMRKLDEILNTPDDSDIRYFVEVDLKYADNLKENLRCLNLMINDVMEKKLKVNLGINHFCERKN